MSTTTKTLDVTLLMQEQNNPADTKTKKISTPCGDITVSGIKDRINSMNTAFNSTQTGGIVDYAQGIKATFQEVETDGGDTYTYIPASISKAEIVTITEDTIYGN